jgi:hypothetical protein
MQALDHQLDRSKQEGPLPSAPACLYIINGSKGRGKTTLLLNLLKTPVKQGGLKKRFDNIILFSPTARSDKKMKPLMEELDAEGKFYDIFDNENSNEAIAKIKAYHEENPDSKCCMIFDDSMADLPKSFEKTGALNKFITQARHYNCWLIFLSQRYIGLSRLIRSQADLISFFKTDNSKELQALIDDVNIDKHVLQALYEHATDGPNGFLHVNMLNRTFYKNFDPIVVK